MCVVLGVLWLLNAPEDLAENSQSKARLEHTDYSVSKIDLEVVDPSRVTPAGGGFEGTDKRVLKGSIWFPTGESKSHPLIIYSHGFAGHHKESSHLTKFLAANGYVVASVNFPLTYTNTPADVPQLVDVINQPGDVSAVIDHLLSLNSNANSQLYQKLDSTNIGALGMSLGALTTGLVSYHPDLKDERLKASVMMAPPLESFSENFFATSPNIKSLLISGSADRVVPEPENATQVQARHPSGWFISLDKGSHLGFANVGNFLRWIDNTDDLGCALLDRVLEKQELPESWDAVIPNTGNVLRNVQAGQPCPEIPGEAMNELRQQWLTRIAVGAFFDMHLGSGERAISASSFFNEKLSSENPEITLRSPR